MKLKFPKIGSSWRCVWDFDYNEPIQYGDIFLIIDASTIDCSMPFSSTKKMIKTTILINGSLKPLSPPMFSEAGWNKFFRKL